MVRPLDIDRAEAAKARLDWPTFVFAFEEEHRPGVLVEIADQLADTDYWKLVRLVWTHADAIWKNFDLWRQLLTASRPSRSEIMEEAERLAFSQLDDPVVIFRGHTEHNRDGWSWTRTWSRAKDFAKTPHGWPEIGTPKVTRGQVSRSNIIAYLTLLDEEEIVIDPAHCYDHESVTIYPTD